MGNEQRPEGQAVSLPQQLGAHKDEQQAQGHTGDDIRVGHGDIRQGHGHLAHFRVQVVNAYGRNRTENCGDEAGEDGHQQGVAQQLQ